MKTLFLVAYVAGVVDWSIAIDGGSMEKCLAEVARKEWLMRTLTSGTSVSPSLFTYKCEYHEQQPIRAQ